MVGNEESDGHQCWLLPGLYCPPQRGGVGTSGACFPECRHPALEGEPCADDGDSENQTPTQADTSAGLHDEGTSGSFSLARTAPITLGEILSYRVVHGEPEERDHWIKVVNGQP
jgi:hypothetical protein